MIEPIETFYAGCRFRSRREARWAVFFDHLGIRWEYEPQGYKFEDGTAYLPDFLIHPGTESAFWFEVKGVHPSEAELAKAQHLATGTGRLVYVYFAGLEPPGPGLTAAIGGDWAAFMPTTFRLTWDNREGWLPIEPDVPSWQVNLTPTSYALRPATDRFPATRPRSGHLWWTDCARCGRIVIKLHGQQGWCPSIGEHEDPGELYPSFRHETPRLLAAYRAARSARYEHGEQPPSPPEDWPPVAGPGTGSDG